MALGRGIRLSPGDQNKLILNWIWPVQSPSGQRDPYCEDRESKITTVQIDRDVIEPSGQNISSTETAFCTVNFSAGNLTQVVEVDIQSGTLITVAGSEISVSASYPIISDVTLPEMNVRAVLGFDGGRPSAGVTSIPRRTIRIGTIENGASSQVLPVPRFAVSAVMRSSTFASPFARLDQIRDPNAGSFINRSVIGKLDQDSVPIATGARFFSLVNNTPNVMQDVSVVFYLGL